jgi:hypothetical protein
MGTPGYSVATIAFDGLPILECTSFSKSIEGRSKRVQTAGHSGVMRARGYPTVTGSTELQIPKTGHEYDYLGKLIAGETVTIRWIDADTRYDTTAIITKVEMTNNPTTGERNCTVSFEGDLVSPAG